MLEKDKQLLRAFRDCFQNVKMQMDNGEDVDYGTACLEEAEALSSYTILIMNDYKEKNPIKMSDKKYSLFGVRAPYFQDF
mmetsp:Transcript_22507/g.17017  ORF Transcript_22507/g.17017 Transcript_22507/m.17017 type:complete len:80 (+) Transcript_22507:18-257(+)